MALLVTTCQDWTPQLSDFQFLSRTSTIDFIRFFKFRGKISSLPKENTCFCKKLPSCASHDTLILCIRHALDWLHLGHFSSPAVVHPAQNMVSAPDGAWNSPCGPLTAQNIRFERKYCPKPCFGCRAPVHQPAQNIALG